MHPLVSPIVAIPARFRLWFSLLLSPDGFYKLDRIHMFPSICLNRFTLSSCRTVQKPSSVLIVSMSFNISPKISMRSDWNVAEKQSPLSWHIYWYSLKWYWTITYSGITALDTTNVWNDTLIFEVSKHCYSIIFPNKKSILHNSNGFHNF